MKKYLLFIPLVISLCAAHNAGAQTPQLFKDLAPGPYPATSNPEGFFNAGNTMYFITRVGPSFIHQLWKSDGTPVNTVMVKDSLIVTNLGDVVNIRGEINGTVFFTKEMNGSTTSSSVTELWKTDGTTAGTVMVTSLTHTQGSGSGGALRNFVVAGNKLFFSMGQNNGRELWVSDGTAAGTMEVIDLAPGMISNQQAAGVADQLMIAYNNKVYFSGCTTTGNAELFSSDGTAQGTTLVAEINPVTTMSGGSDPEGFKIYNNELYFFADDGTSNSSNGLWKTDGTTTTKVFQNPLTSSQATIFKNEIYFANGIDLWKTNGTTGGTVMVNDSAAITILGANNDYLFSVYQQYIPTPPYYIYHYWRTDGTGGNTPVSYNLANSASFSVINNKMYISRADSGSFTQFGIWETDGTEAGTSKIATFGAGLHIFNNTLFFAHYDGATGTELWSFSPSSTTTSSAGPVGSTAQMKIYPNPSAGAFQLVNEGEKILSVNVYDLSGKEIFSSYDLMSDQRIDLNAAPGMYMLRVRTGKGISTGKLIIQ